MALPATSLTAEETVRVSGVPATIIPEVHSNRYVLLKVYLTEGRSHRHTSIVDPRSGAVPSPKSAQVLQRTIVPHEGMIHRVKISPEVDEGFARVKGADHLPLVVQRDSIAGLAVADQEVFTHPVAPEPELRVARGLNRAYDLAFLIDSPGFRYSRSRSFDYFDDAITRFACLAAERGRAPNQPSEYDRSQECGSNKRGDRSADSLVRANVIWRQKRADTAIRAPTENPRKVHISS